jgi:branched-chain amino acid transport system ATP-binding protein
VRVAEPILELHNLVKRFGAVAASDGIDLAVETGVVHALIGPNGAGKTTVIAEIAGEIRPDSGRICFRGRDITRWPVHRRATAGLQRSYQITSVFSDFNVLDNVALAVQAREGHAFRFWPSARRRRSLQAPALAALERVGLAKRADIAVGDLAHGEQRQLELAMVLATEPALLLLDEPTAGMAQGESRRMMEILKPLKGSLTVILVEHDMDVVFALADVVTVLVNGRVLATGSPEAIRSNPDVRRAYLGGHA